MQILRVTSFHLLPTVANTSSSRQIHKPKKKYYYKQMNITVSKKNFLYSLSCCAFWFIIAIALAISFPIAYTMKPTSSAQSPPPPGMPLVPPPSSPPPTPETCHGHQDLYDGRDLLGHDSFVTRPNDGDCCSHSHSDASYCAYKTNSTTCVHYIGTACYVSEPSGRRLSETSEESVHLKLPPSPPPPLSPPLPPHLPPPLSPSQPLNSPQLPPLTWIRNTTYALWLNTQDNSDLSPNIPRPDDYKWQYFNNNGAINTCKQQCVNTESCFGFSYSYEHYTNIADAYKPIIWHGCALHLKQWIYRRSPQTLVDSSHNKYCYVEYLIAERADKLNINDDDGMSCKSIPP